jgi:hypothetical protein
MPVAAHEDGWSVVGVGLAALTISPACGLLLVLGFSCAATGDVLLHDVSKRVSIMTANNNGDSFFIIYHPPVFVDLKKASTRSVLNNCFLRFYISNKA